MRAALLLLCLGSPAAAGVYTAGPSQGVVTTDLNGQTISPSNINGSVTFNAPPIGISSVSVVTINDSTNTATFTTGCFLNGVTGSSVTVTLSGTQRVRVKFSGEVTVTGAVSNTIRLNILQNGNFPAPFTSTIGFADNEVSLDAISDPQTLHKEWVFNPGVGTWTYCLEMAVGGGTGSFPNGTSQFSAEIVQ